MLEAIETVPRELFLEEIFADRAYDDNALPIACGQTISQPFIVAFMTDRLKLDKRHKVLEIGTGSGYQTAILSQLCRRVYTIERYRTLAAQAGERFKAAASSPTSRRWSATAPRAGPSRRPSTASS